MRGGTYFSININLSSHRHIDHAVVIPKRHLYHRKPGAINIYNTVKIRNINKTVIVKNYKPLQTAERLWDRKHSTKVTRTGTKVARIRDTEKRIEIQRERNAEKAREVIRSGNHERKRARSIRIQRNMPKERTVTGKYEKGSRRTVEKKHSGAIKNNRTAVLDKAARVRGGRPEQTIRERTVTKRERAIVKKRVAANDNPRRSVAKEDRRRKRGNRAGQAQVETSRKRMVKQESKTVVTGKNRADTGRQMKKNSRLTQRQVERKQNRDKKAYKENNGKYKAEKKSEENNRERKTVRNVHNSREKSASREKREYRQKTGRNWYATSLDSRRFR
jgi:hypothetical protein